MDFPEVLHPDERLQFWIDINDCSKYAHLCRIWIEELAVSSVRSAIWEWIEESGVQRGARGKA